jgi:hypothetical protein
MAKTSWFIGGVKRKLKKPKTGSSKSKDTISQDGRLTIPSLGASFGGTDPEQERDAPPEATSVAFPTHEPRKGHAWTPDSPPPNFQSLFSRVLKPSDISEQHLQALNISVPPTCSVGELVPDAYDGSSYLEPKTPRPTSDAAVNEDGAKANAEIARKRKEFDDRLAELRIDNDLAFRTLCKRVPAGTKPPRIAFMRKFYEGLESMSQYWDCSLDQYYEVSETDRGDDGEQCAKRQRLENGFSPKGGTNEASATDGEHSLPILASQPSKGDAESKAPPPSAPNPQPPEAQDATDATSRHLRSTSVTPEPQTRKRYKGRRTSTGREMPDQFRVDTVRAFVEGTVWAFHSALSIPRVMPLVQFNKLNLPVRQTAAAYRMPSDRIKGRQGWQEGPMLSLQVRAETEFLDSDGEAREQMCKLDLLREVAGLLQLAQERRREGRKEIKPGEGKWWTQKPRWGGGEGGEAQNEVGNTDILAAAEELLGAAREREGKKAKDGRREPKKKTPALLWKELKVGRGNWDPRTEYIAIGKEPSSEWDEVCLPDHWIAGVDANDVSGVSCLLTQPPPLNRQVDCPRRVYGLSHFGNLTSVTA